MPEMTDADRARCEAAGWAFHVPTCNFQCLFCTSDFEWETEDSVWCKLDGSRACTPCLLNHLDAQESETKPVGGIACCFCGAASGPVKLACPPCLEATHPCAECAEPTLGRKLFFGEGGIRCRDCIDAVNEEAMKHAAVRKAKRAKEETERIEAVEKEKTINRAWAAYRVAQDAYEQCGHLASELGGTSCVHEVLRDKRYLAACEVSGSGPTDEAIVERMQASDDAKLREARRSSQHPGRARGWNERFGWPGLA